jgi:hypothetical protein
MYTCGGLWGLDEKQAGFCFHGREFNDDVLAMEDDLCRSSRSSIIQVVLCNV